MPGDHDFTRERCLLAELRREQYQELYEDRDESLSAMPRGTLRWIAYGAVALLGAVLVSVAYIPIPEYREFGFVLDGPVARSSLEDEPAPTSAAKTTGDTLGRIWTARLYTEGASDDRLREGQSATLVLPLIPGERPAVAHGITDHARGDSGRTVLLVHFAPQNSMRGRLRAGQQGTATLLIDHQPLLAKLVTGTPQK